MIHIDPISLLTAQKAVWETALSTFQQMKRNARPIHTTDTRPADWDDDYATWLDNQKAAIDREIRKIKRATKREAGDWRP